MRPICEGQDGGRPTVAGGRYAATDFHVISGPILRPDVCFRAVEAFGAVPGRLWDRPVTAGRRSSAWASDILEFHA